MPCAYPGVVPASGVQTIRTCTHYIRVKVIVCRQHWSIETIQWIHLLTSIFVCVAFFFPSPIRVEPAYRPCWWPKGWAFVTFSLCTSCTGTAKYSQATQAHIYTRFGNFIYWRRAARLVLAIIHFMLFFHFLSLHLLNYFKTIRFWAVRVDIFGPFVGNGFPGQSNLHGILVGVILVPSFLFSVKNLQDFNFTSTYTQAILEVNTKQPK